jgi:hypothetical protein
MTVHRRGTRMPDLQLESLSVKAGVLENATYPADMITDQSTGKSMPDPRAGMKVADVAIELEYGSQRMPPRPAFQMTVARESDRWVDGLVTLLMRGYPVEQALRTIGQVMKEDLQFALTEWPADNNEQWAQFKGFNHGWIFTGTLIRSIEAEIET